MSVYVDTSVLVAYYVPEIMSDEVEEALLKHPEPVISDLTEVEFHSALARKLRGGGITAADATRVRGLFFSHLEAGSYERLPFERRYFLTATSWFTR